MEVDSAIEVDVLGGGHTIAGNRRGPRITGMSLGRQVNFFRGDSCAAAGVLYTGAESLLSMTVLSPGGHALSDMVLMDGPEDDDLFEMSLTILESDI
jgi:hypothetical protein